MTDFASALAKGSEFLTQSSLSLMGGHDILEEQEALLVLPSVRDYVKQKGGISTAEVIEHFRVSLSVANRIIGKLISEGVLIPG